MTALVQTLVLVAAPFAVLAGARAEVPQDLASELERLRASSAAERDKAVQWLARHLTPGDYAPVRGAILAGDAESRRRLAQALSDDERHVALAVRLAAGPQEALAAVGRAALTESIARWSPGWNDPPLSARDTVATMRSRVPGLFVLDPRTRPAPPDAGLAGLGVALDALARSAGATTAAPPLVLDPDLALAARARGQAGELRGAFERVLDDLARLHRAELAGFAFDDELAESERNARPWILVRRSVAKTSGAAREGAADPDGTSALAHVIDWCLAIDGAGDPARRGACACALAATAWPAGIAWLERRWTGEHDLESLDGVLLAAGRGLVVPALAQPSAQRDLYALAGSDLARKDVAARVRVDAIARAIGAAGPTGAQGEDLVALALEGWGRLSVPELWLRLVVLESDESSSPDARAALDRVLGARAPDALPPGLRFQALRARAATVGSGAEAALGEPWSLFAWAELHDKLPELVGLLRATGARPPPDRPKPASQDVRLAILEWTFFRGDVAAAAGELATALSADARAVEVVAARARGWIGRGARPRFDEVVAAARQRGAPAADVIDRFELLSGAGSQELRARLLDRAIASHDARAGLLDLAACAADARGAEARAALIAALPAPGDASDRMDALDRAVAELRAARMDAEEADFARAVLAAARDATPELRPRLRIDMWPTRPEPPTVRVADRDRSLALSGL